MKEILFKFARTHPVLVLLNLGLMAFAPIYEILLPYMYGKMIMDITTDRVIGTLVILVTVVLIAQSGFLLRDWLNERFVPVFESFVKTEIVDMILVKYMESFHTLTTGDIIYKITKIPDIIMYWFQWLNDYIVPYIFVFVTAIVYFARFDWMIAGAFFVFLLILFAVSYLSPRVCLKHARENDRVFTSLHEFVEDIIHNMPSIYSSNTKEAELEKLRAKAIEYGTNFAKTSRCTRGFKAFMLPVVAALIIAFVLRSKVLLGTGAVSKKRFVPMFMILTSMLSSIFWLVDIMRYSVFDLGSLSNMTAMLASEPMQERAIMPFEAPRNVIGCRELVFGYTQDKPILDGLSIDFEEGKVTVLAGTIGAGKTTLLKLLLGFHVPSQGDCYLNGRWYRGLDIAQVREHIGYVPQNPVLFNETVLYNVQYGNHATVEEVKTIARKLGIHDGFLDRPVGKNGMSLSGGQRQLVWCLRVFFQNPPIVLMDEPTANMDDETKDLLILLLRTLMRGRTVIIVTHDSYIAEYADVQVTL